MMAPNLLKKNNSNSKYISYLVFFLGFILQLIYLHQFDDYFDDWNFFYTVDPNISNSQTWQRHYYGDRGEGVILREAFPWNFSYLTKYFLKFTGYTIENTHYFLLLFSVFSIFFFYKFINLILKDFKFLFLASILFATNLFLIRELNSLRPHSAVMFLSLLSNYFFILIFIKNKKKTLTFILYIISTFCMLSLWPHSLALLGGHFIFLLIIFLKKKNFLNFCSPLIVLTFYVILNYKYIKYIIIENDWSYTPFSFTFFINFFFRSFFSSLIFGGIMLFIFLLYLLKEIKINFNNYKKNKFLSIPIFKNNEKNFLIINILSIYASIVAYSIFKESVIAAKYFLILVPLIITWISIKISEQKKKIIYNLVIIFTISNSIYYWNNLPISRPPVREVLKIINSNNIKNIYTTESIVFNNYLSHYNYSINNKLVINKIENFKNIKTTENFAVVCLNYPRASFGVSYINLEDPKCSDLIDNENMQIEKKILIPDFLILIAKFNI
jgi:hypothetical protein